MNAILREAFNEILEVTDNIDVEFRYEREEDNFTVYANGVTLNGHDDDIRLEFQVNDGGGAAFYAIFDKLDEAPEQLRALNEFNRGSLYLTAYTTGKGFLTLRHFTVWSEPSEIADFAKEAITRLVDMQDEPLLHNLTRYTR